MNAALTARLERLLALEEKALTYFRAVVLLIIRLFWGWQFFLSGRGKFGRVDQVTEFFTSLGIPAPRLNVYMAASTECFGGLLLLIGLGCSGLPIVPIALAFTMFVALATDDRDKLVNMFSDPDKLVGAAPFLFFLASIIVLAFGPGLFSADKVIATLWRRKHPAAPAATKTA